MIPGIAIVRNEARLLRHDPVPGVVLIAMPAVLMALLTPALGLALAAQGAPPGSGAQQSVPGMISVFSFFVVAIASFALFREHGWRTWVRLRGDGVEIGDLVSGKLALPAVMLAAQHVALFAIGLVFLGLDVTGSWLAIGATSVAFSTMILLMGLAAAAAFETIQQVNVVTNLGAMVLGGLGGGFVPVSTLPAWIQPLAPLSPSYWAMSAYTTVIRDGGGLADIGSALAVMATWAVALLAVAVWRLRSGATKRTWG